MKMFSYRTKSTRVAVACAIFSACWLSACTEPPSTPPEPPQPIVQGNQIRFVPQHPQLALLKLSPASAVKTLSVDLPARMVWNEEKTQRIYPAFAGRVAAIRADVGQAVQVGSPLALVASPDFASAQADAAKAQADARLTQKALERQKELLQAGIVARKDYEQAEADAARANAEWSRAQARTSLYGGGAAVDQQLFLRSSLSGWVVERNINPGQELRPDQSGPGVPPLFVVSDPFTLWVQIDARESEVGTLKPGSTFELIVPSLPDQKFTGKVIAATDAIDPATRTIKVRGVVDNKSRMLKAEMLATARFERSMGQGVMVPATAVMLRGAQHALFVQTAAGTYEERLVKLSYEGSAQVVVASGLEVGEQVVIENALLLGRQLKIARELAGPAK